MSRVIVVFAKYPEPGRVKTRLIGPLTADTAAVLQRRCLEATLASVRQVVHAKHKVAITPDNADFSGLVSDEVALIPQGDGDLGIRLRRAFDAEFTEGFRQVVVVGSDCPGMTPVDVSQAFSLLESHDAVIGPAADGGYYLLGLGRPVPALFESVDWSSPRVARQTRSRAKRAGLSLAELPIRRDVDDYDDVVALASEIPEEDVRLAGLRRFLRDLLVDGGNHG